VVTVGMVTYSRVYQCTVQYSVVLSPLLSSVLQYALVLSSFDVRSQHKN